LTTGYYDDEPETREFLLTTFRETYKRIMDAAKDGKSKKEISDLLLAESGATNWTEAQQEVWSGFVAAMTRPEAYVKLDRQAQAIVDDALAEINLERPGRNDGHHRERGRPR
jgi:hypothetical protein